MRSPRRDRAQLAAHDEALRSKFSGLSTEELVARRDELRVAAGRGESMESQRRSLQERIERAREHIEGFGVEREAARLETEVQKMPVVGDAARRELAVADQVLAQRRELAIIAARISPSAYIKNELAERPSDPAMRKAWDRGRHADRALGREAKRGAERARQEAARRRLLEAQRALGLGQHATRARRLGRGLSIGR